jgi:RsiW-degrading membrane proteinase PrsW (M82 family)
MQRSIHFPTILQLLISGFGLLIFGGSAAGLFVAGIMSLMGSGFVFIDVFPLFSMAWTAAAVSILLLPALVLALMRLFGKEDRLPRIRNGLRLSSILMLAWPLLLLLGYYLTGVDELGIILVPPIQILAIAIPLWWFFELGRRGLQGNHSQRNWGVLSAALVVTPTVIILIELALLILAGIAVVVWLSTQPQLLEEINRTAQRLMNSQLDPEATFRILRPYLQQPLVLYAIMAITAGIIPLIEELFKPLALWGLASLRFTPANGFVAGLICGAGFALIESLGMLASGAVGLEWVTSVTARLGTGLLHMVTVGIVGYGLASAWSRALYGRLAGIFFAAVLLHGIWNFFGVLVGVAPVLEGQAVPENLAFLSRFNMIAPAALVILGIVLFLILMNANRHLRLDASQSAIEPINASF